MQQETSAKEDDPSKASIIALIIILLSVPCIVGILCAQRNEIQKKHVNHHKGHTLTPKNSIAFGNINEHLVGQFMKNLVTTGITMVQDYKNDLTAKSKTSIKDTPDFVTQLDILVQERNISAISECFPDYGIIAEEKNLRKKSAPGCELYFVLDPIDGTKALLRGQSHGISTMVALVSGLKNRQVLAVCIGDIRSGDLYYFRPNAEKVLRYSHYRDIETLKGTPRAPFNETTALIVKDIEGFSPIFQTILKPVKYGGFIGNREQMSGSIGVLAARLWKREVGCLALRSRAYAPWDIIPVMGISEKLGFVFMSYDETSREFKENRPKITKSIVREPTEWLVIHKTRVDQLNELVQSISPN